MARTCDDYDQIYASVVISRDYCRNSFVSEINLVQPNTAKDLLRELRLLLGLQGRNDWLEFRWIEKKKIFQEYRHILKCSASYSFIRYSFWCRIGFVKQW